MYVIERALPKAARPLGWMFAICGFFGTFTLFQVNQLALYGETYYGLEKIWVGVVFSIITGIVLLGGLRGISRFCEVVVPIMSVLYFVVVAIILIVNIDKAPGVFGSIFREAISPSSAFGGILGYGFLHILTTGTKRATFSNESGIGTAPMAHSNSRTTEPVSEGYVAMLGPFIDTIIVCSLTAFAILVTFPQGAPEGVSGIQLTTMAFTEHMGISGQHFLAVSIVMFALSTMIGVANYNQKCWDYIFKGRWIFRDKSFIMVFCGSLLVGAIIPMDNVVNFMDIAFALMTIPNIIATVYLAKRVRRELDLYNSKKKL
jgi:alanine or glycine:cation symporter, AGCS family